MARKRGNNWQGSLKTEEKYHRYSFPTKSLAEAWEDEAKRCLQENLPIPKPSSLDRSRQTLGGFFDSYMRNIWPTASERNVVNNQRVVESILGRNTELNRIDQKRITVMVEEMQERGNAASTINTRLSHLKTLLGYAQRQQVIDTVPLMPWQSVGDNSRLRFLTVEEEGQILARFVELELYDQYWLVKLLIDTGCRPSEIIRGNGTPEPLSWSEVSEMAGGSAPDVISGHTVRPVININRTKTGKSRTIPLTVTATDALLYCRSQDHPRPFHSLSVERFSSVFQSVAASLNLQGVVLYTLRHTCASRLVQRGADIRRVMEWMGHTNINTTLRYAKLAPNDLFELEKLL